MPIYLPIINIAITFALIGLIWVIQLVHYPSFHYVAEEQFIAFHQHHTFSITIIVMPLMLAELALGAWLAMKSEFHWHYLVPLIFVLLIWGSTFLLSVPFHQQLGAGKNVDFINRLVSTNWNRTVLWTLKGAWLLYLLK